MAKNDENVNEILLELNKALSKLTGKELKVATVEFKAPSKEALAAAVAREAEKARKQAEEKKKEAPAAGQKPEEANPEPVKMLKASPPPEEPAKQEKPAPDVNPEAPKPAAQQKPEAADKPAEIPSDIAPEQVFRLSCYYPKGSADLIEVFFQNLSDVLHKTTKKRYYISREIIAEADYAALNMKKAAADAKAKNSDAVFFISNEPVEFEAEGIYSRNILSEQVKKRFFYVDLVVELVLAKKK